VGDNTGEEQKKTQPPPKPSKEKKLSQEKSKNCRIKEGKKDR